MVKNSDGTIKDKKAILAHATANISRLKLAQFNNHVMAKYIDLLTRKDVREIWLKFYELSDDEKIILAQNILDEMVKVFDISGKIIPYVPVVPNDKRPVMAFWTSNKDPNKCRIEINLKNSENLQVESFLRNLFHEFIHLLDHYTPNITPLGAQISHVSEKNGVEPNEDEDAYYTNPTEINAYMTRYKLLDIIQYIKNFYLSDDGIKKEIPQTPFHFFTNAKMKD